LARILVISPSGEVYDHDNVRWYQHADTQRSIGHYHNSGDMFVFDSSLKLLKFDHLEDLNIREVDPKAIDRYNRECDYVFLRGSNYIHSEMDWEQAEAVLSKLKIPVLAFGVGAQAPAKGKLELSPGGRRIWQLISERSTTLGVRGAYTAEVLWDMGIKNVRIVGCPTAFRNNDPNLRIDLPALDRVREVGFTVRREVSKAYSPDVKLYITRHRDIMKQMAQRFDLRLMMQGEVEEKLMLWGTAEQKKEAWTKLKSEAWWRDWFFDEDVEKLWRSRLFYSDVVSDYETLVRKKHLVLGYRLHGNLMALSNKVPSVYFTYDSRTVEFAETFGIPSYDVYSDKEFRLEDYWHQELFEKFNRSYHQRYQDMRVFLDENGVDHKMKARPVFRKAA
jgi:Polysaccharide pyruvyl transferase